jgi:hypothetical protein
MAPANVGCATKQLFYQQHASESETSCPHRRSGRMRNDRFFFLSRAEEEETRAGKAQDGAAQQAHLSLAEYYRAAARKFERRSAS